MFQVQTFLRFQILLGLLLVAACGANITPSVLQPNTVENEIKTPSTDENTSPSQQETEEVNPPPSSQNETPPTPPSLAITAGMSWYWQLQGTLDTNKAAQIYDIDLFDTSKATIAALKAKGKIVICYFSAGTYENWRSDASQFPTAALGANMDDWPGEKWLDVRNQQVRAIMSQRMDLAKSKGCDGVEPDNVDGYANKNGVSLTKNDQINYNSFLADTAHQKNLVIALKNSTDLVSSLVSKFDFAVVEECYQYKECDQYLPFVRQNKAVLIAEYSAFSNQSCSDSKSKKFSTVFYNLDLNGKKFDPCP